MKNSGTFSYQYNDANLQKMRDEYYKNKAEFEKNQYRMNIYQIQLNNILLKYEEDQYLDQLYKSETKNQFLQRREREFMRMFTCCDRGFETFSEFVAHKENVHNERQCEDGEDNDESEYRYVPLKSSTSEENISSEEVDKTKAFKCTVEGCHKNYTSAYGLRYHLEKGHVNETKKTKPYRCSEENCEKRYKNMNGLKYHLAHGHTK